MSTLSRSPPPYHHEAPDHDANGQNVEGQYYDANNYVSGSCTSKLYIYPEKNRYWDQKWLDMWSMSTGPLHWLMSTLVMVIRWEVPLYARLVPDVLCGCSKI